MEVNGKYYHVHDDDGKDYHVLSIVEEEENLFIQKKICIIFKMVI